MSALFPADGPEITARLTPPSGLNYRLAGQVRLRECQRCWAWVENLDGHELWHGSVDTGATVKLAAGSTLVRNADPCAACGTTADVCSERRRRHDPLCCPDCDRIDGHRERI